MILPERGVTGRRFRHFAQGVDRRFRAARRRVADIETTLDPLVDHVAHTERDLQELQQRVTRLERRRGQRSRQDA